MAVIIPGMTIYTSVQVQQYVYESRMRERGGNNKDNRTLVYSLSYPRGRYCALVYQPDTYGQQHIDFYALSDGWEVLTDTGYWSYFFSYASESAAMMKCVCIGLGFASRLDWI